MKKIGFLIETFPSPTEHFIQNELLEFDRMGIDIHVLALRKGDVKSKKNSFNIDYIKYNIDLILWMKFLFRLQYLKFLVSNLIKSSSIKNALRFLKRLGFCVKLREILNEEGIEHIHSHFAFITTEIALLLSQLFDIKYSFTCHAQDIYVNHPNKLGTYIREALFVITCTKYNESYLNKITENRFKEKIYCVYHGLDLGEIKLLKSSKKETLKIPFKITCVARLVEKKGIIYLLKAISLLSKKGLAIKCEIIGKGVLSNDLNRYTEDNSISEKVFFLGELSHEQTLQKIKYSDIFVLPCIIAENGDRDGLPNTILEAMALGKPVISTPVSAISEVIDNRINGILVSPKNEKEIAAEIEKLINDTQYFEKIGNNASQAIVNHFNIHNSTNRLISIFDKNIKAFI